MASASSSRPPSPPLPKRSLSNSFDKFREEMSEWSSALTLLDTVETYFDSHVDLLQRKLQKHSDKLKLRADQLQESFKLRDLSRDLRELNLRMNGDALAENLDREVKNLRIRLSARMTKLTVSWQSAKVVRTRDKVSFFLGVMSLLCSSLLFGLAPQYIHILYTIQGLVLLPLRAYIYKKRAWHYFLFDLCYFVTILNFIWLWLFPSNVFLFVACYSLSHGSLASAVITWRNSLVFHDLDKVTSLFIHIYAPFTFTVIRHFYPGASDRFPALAKVEWNVTQALLVSGGLYIIWQGLYWKFVLVDRRAKIESGQRTTSFSFLLNDKRGVIGRSLSALPVQSRIAAFMGGQLLYMILTELPGVWLLYWSKEWSGAFLMFIFAVSVWNGGGYYIEVFGRKFERELEALRKELAESARTSGRSSPTGTSTPARSNSDDGLSSLNGSPVLVEKTLPALVDTPESDISALISEDKKNI